MLGIGTGINYASESAVSTDLKQATSGSAEGLRLWLQNGVGVTAAKWADSSGFDNHATQSSEANQAAVSGGGLDFEETESDHYDLASTITISENQGFCMAAVIDQESASDNMILSKDSNDHIKIADQNTFRFISNDDTQTTTTMRFTDSTVFAAGSKMLILLNRSAGAANRFTFFKNGTQLTFDTDTSTNEAEGENPFGFDINVLGARAGTSQFFDGKILEIAFWNRSLTAQEITDVNSYLLSIHGL